VRALATQFLILFSGLCASAYDGLTPVDSKHLLEKALKICSEIKEFAQKEKDNRLSQAHKRHCLEPKEPQISGLIGAFYHMGIDLKGNDSKKRDFYNLKLAEISLLTQLKPDYKTPPVKWDINGSIFELSGFAPDYKNNKVWSLGDSGTGAFIANLDLATSKTQRIKVYRARNVDWEALVFAEEGQLLLLDVGDNKRVRRSVSLYEVNTNEVRNNSVGAKRFDFSYPERAMDCEAAVVMDHVLYLFEKVYFEKPRVYAMDLRKNPLQPKLLGRLPVMGLITDASLTRDNRLFVLTYQGVDEVENWRHLEKAKIKSIINDQFGQIEALAALSPTQFLIGREDGKIFEISTTRLTKPASAN